MSNKVHKYEISSAIAKAEVYVHEDKSYFNALFRKVIRLNRILELWNFGLFFEVNNQIFWLDLDHDKYSSYSIFPTNEFGVILLHLGVITYPLNAEKEIWSESAALLFFYDMSETLSKIEQTTNLSPETKVVLFAIEHLIKNKKTNYGTQQIDRFLSKELQKSILSKANQLSGLTCLQLMKRYFVTLYNNDFEKKTGKFICNSNKVHLNITNKNLIINNAKITSKYAWDKVQISKVKDLLINIVVEGNSEKNKMRLKFDAKDMAKQFYYLTVKHICQNEISSKEPKDAEFLIIKSISLKEQELIENFESLKMELQNINTNNSSFKNEIDCLNNLNNNMKEEIKEYSLKFKKLEKENQDLQAKLGVYEMKTSKIHEKENENKLLRNELEKLKAEKKNEIEKYKSEIDQLKKKMALMEDRIKRESKIEKSVSVKNEPTNNFSLKDVLSGNKSKSKSVDRSDLNPEIKDVGENL